MVTLSLGFIAVLFPYLPGHPFRPEQFDLPKEVALCILGGVCAGQAAIWQKDDFYDVKFELLIAIGFWLGVLLASLVAVNTDIGWRTLGMFSASMCLFIFARRAGRSSITVKFVIGMLCICLFVLASIVLLESYGGISFVSSPGRRPGATLGNRNLAARVLCLSLPVFWILLVLCKGKWIRRLITMEVAFAVAAITLSRSRGAFLTTTIIALILPFATILLSGDSDKSRFLVLCTCWFAAILGGSVLPVGLPNKLGWHSRDFANSARSVGDFRTGTGRGRVIQAETTVKLLHSSHYLGVGPGNWSIMYASVAPPGDPSVELEAFNPAPLIPRNDILSFAAEFGCIGILLLFASALLVVKRAVKRLRNSVESVRMSGLLILAMLFSAALLGAFDSVMRVAPSIAIVLIVIGLALGEIDGTSMEVVKKHRVCLRIGRITMLTCYGAVSLFAARRSFQDVAVLRIFSSFGSAKDLYRAVEIAPNNVEARMMLSFFLIGAERCDLALPHLAQARRLQPMSGKVKGLSTDCEKNLGLSRHD